MIFTVKTFTDCSLLPCQRMPRPQILQRKLLQISTKLWNSRKFSPSKVSHYTVLTRNVFGPSVPTLSCGRKGRENLCLFVYFVTSFWSSCTKWTSASAVQTNNWAKFIILLVWWASARTWRDHYHYVSSLFCSETVSQVQTEKEALSRHTSASSQKEKGCVSAEREEIGACIGLHG